VKYKYYQDRGFPIFTHKISLSWYNPSVSAKY
jgi:hypothetical protein